jgi:hypothetical protein
MQKQLKLVLLFTVASFILFTGFKRDNPVSSSVNSIAKRTAVTITGVYDFSTFPNVSGTFTTTGALTISGRTTMDIDEIVPGSIFHCVVTLFASMELSPFIRYVNLPLLLLRDNGRLLVVQVLMPTSGAMGRF